MSLKVRITVTKRYYMRPDVHEDGYYQVVRGAWGADRYRWEWHEHGEAPDAGPWLSTISGALRHAAGDWDNNAGSVLTSDLARRLRLAAAAYKRQGS